MKLIKEQNRADLLESEIQRLTDHILAHPAEGELDSAKREYNLISQKCDALVTRNIELSNRIKDLGRPRRLEEILDQIRVLEPDLPLPSPALVLTTLELIGFKRRAPGRPSKASCLPPFCPATEPRRRSRLAPSPASCCRLSSLRRLSRWPSASTPRATLPFTSTSSP